MEGSTNFLTPRGQEILAHLKPAFRFTPEKKQAFLELAKIFIEEKNQFPSIHGICKVVGVSIQAFEDHLKMDAQFKHEWQEIIAILRSVYTSKLAIKADSANGIVANLAILKFLETGSFVDRLQVNSSHTSVTDKRVNEAIIVDIDPEIDVSPANASLPATNIQDNYRAPA